MRKLQECNNPRAEDITMHGRNNDSKSSTGHHGHLQCEDSASLTQHVAVSALHAPCVKKRLEKCLKKRMGEYLSHSWHAVYCDRMALSSTALAFALSAR